MADTLQGGKAARAVVRGITVAKATTAIAGATTKTLFTVAGGAVLVTNLVGIVTVIVQAQANAAKLIATPTVGTAVDLCATLDINAAEVGAMLSISGLATDAMLGGVSKSGAVSSMYRAVNVMTGVIGLNTAADSTGSIRWIITYIPLDDGASIS